MRVGIEASAALASERGGVGNYAAHLIAGLQRLACDAPDVELVYFSNRYQVQPGENPARLGRGDIYPADQLPTRLLWLQAGLPRSIRRAGVNLCHFPNHLGPVLSRASVPFVVTMHDMSVYRCPEHHTRKTVTVHRMIMPALVRRNCWIATDSESARADIVQHLRVPEDRVRAIYCGIDARYGPAADPGDAAVLRRHGIRYPYVLTVGTLEPRKNHARLIDAFGDVVLQERLDHHLVIVGNRGWKTELLLERMRKSPVADRIHVLGFVPTADLPALYRGADAFAFPSLYEGFGLPVLEALASAVPTLISHDPALTEISGEGATLKVDAHSRRDIARGLHTILTDRRLRQVLRASGPRRAAGFSWDQCAAATLQLYREVSEARNPLGQRLAV